MDHAFTVGTFSSSQANAGVVLPRQFVPYKLRTLTISNPGSSIAAQTRLKIKDGAGQILFEMLCGPTVGSVDFHIFARNFAGTSDTVAYLPEVDIQPGWTVTIENGGLEGFESVTAILSLD